MTMPAALARPMALITCWLGGDPPSDRLMTLAPPVTAASMAKAIRESKKAQPPISFTTGVAQEPGSSTRSA